VVIQGPVNLEAISDEHGWATVRGIVPGDYQIQVVTPDGRKLPRTKLSYPTGKTVANLASADAKPHEEGAAS
jgi:hypothetical protein